MDKIMFCKSCSVELNKAFVYNHFNSEEHKDIENFFILKCTTYCDYCDRKIKNDELREHITSGKHLELEEKKY